MLNFFICVFCGNYCEIAQISKLYIIGLQEFTFCNCCEREFLDNNKERVYTATHELLYILVGNYKWKLNDFNSKILKLETLKENTTTHPN